VFKKMQSITIPAGSQKITAGSGSTVFVATKTFEKVQTKDIQSEKTVILRGIKGVQLRE
jgi:hypothetical protein